MDTIMTFKAGEAIIEEGDEGSWAFVIISGRVKVLKQKGSGEIPIAVMEAGQVFGEMSLIEDRPRSATVKAETDVKLRVINRRQFNDLLKENPSTLIPIMKSLFERLRQASELLASNRAMNTVSGVRAENDKEIIMEGQSEKAKRALDSRKLLISSFPFCIGRYVPYDSNSDVFYNNNMAIEEEEPYVISRNHLSINYEGGKVWIVDRGSSFGAVLNGKEIGGKAMAKRLPLDKEQNQLIIGPPTSGYVFLLTEYKQ